MLVKIVYVIGVLIQYVKNFEEVGTNPSSDDIFIITDLSNTLQDTITKSLILLNDDEEAQSTKCQRFLNLTRGFEKKTRNFFKVYQKIKKITRVNRTKQHAFDLNNVENEAFIGKLLRSDNLIKVNENENVINSKQSITTQDNIHNFTAHLTYLRSNRSDLNNLDEDILSINKNNSSEDFDYIKQIVKRFHSLTIEDFVKANATRIPSQKSRESQELWDPISDMEMPMQTRRLFRPKFIHIKKFPFVANIIVMGKTVCGGAIIARDLVITAASCLQIAYNNRFYRENPRVLAVRVGSNHRDSGGETVQITEVFFHPAYNPKSLRHNLVIVRLLRELQFSYHRPRVKRITIDRTPQTISDLIDGIEIIGWGYTGSKNKNRKKDLQHAVLNFYHLIDCKEVYSSSYVHKENFCAGFLSKGGGACGQDGGNPGVVGGKLIGIVSFGPYTCGAIDAPTVFTKIGFYADWIDSIVDMRTVKIRLSSTTLRIPLIYQRITKSPVSTSVQPIQRTANDERDILAKFLRALLSGDIQLDDLYEDIDVDQDFVFQSTLPDVKQDYEVIQHGLIPYDSYNVNTTTESKILTNEITQVAVWPQEEATAATLLEDYFDIDGEMLSIPSDIKQSLPETTVNQSVLIDDKNQSKPLLRLGNIAVDGQVNVNIDYESSAIENGHNEISTSVDENDDNGTDTKESSNNEEIQSLNYVDLKYSKQNEPYPNKSISHHTSDIYMDLLSFLGITDKSLKKSVSSSRFN